jgi:hypothetical protein
MVESTTPDLNLVNVLPDFKTQKVPIPLTLIKSAVRGVIQVSIRLEPNPGILDLFRVDIFEPQNTKVLTLVKTPPEDGFVIATEEAVRRRLQAGIMQFRIELMRKTPDEPLPYFKALRLRYQLQPGSTRIPFNIPLGDATIQLQDLGLWEQFTSLTFFTDNTLKNISNEDWLVDTRSGKRWKVTSVKKEDPLGINTAWFLNCRLIQPTIDAFAHFYI